MDLERAKGNWPLEKNKRFRILPLNFHSIFLDLTDYIR